MKNTPKTDVRHWKQRVTFPTPDSRTYAVQIQFGGRRSWIPFYTANKKQAATLARDFYEDLRANGWETALAHHKGAPPEKKVNVTIGEYLEAVAAKSLFSPKTLKSYAQALRKIAGDITQARGREKRDSTRLCALTAEKIEAWRVDFIRRKATDPLAEKSARISASSFLLRARALFAPQTVARIRNIVELPEPLPFSGVKAETIHAPRYRATFDMVALLESAREELATTKPEQYKIFLLGAMAGLRRNEIDVLPWTAFRFEEGVIRIETTEFYRPKSHDSEGDVLVDPELMELFRGYHARARGGFVIESVLPPPPFDAPYGDLSLPGPHAGAPWLASWQRRQLKDSTPHAQKGIWVADQCPLWAACRQRGVASWRHCRHRPPLRREQAAIGLGLRTSPCKGRANHRSDGNEVERLSNKNQTSPEVVRPSVAEGALFDAAEETATGSSGGSGKLTSVNPSADEMRQGLHPPRFDAQ